MDSDPTACAAPRGDADAAARPGGASLLGGFSTESFFGSGRGGGLGGSGAARVGSVVGSGAGGNGGNGIDVGAGWRHAGPPSSAAQLPRDRHGVGGAQVEALLRLRTAPLASAPKRTPAPGSERRVIKMKGGRSFTREQFLAAGKDEWDTPASASAPPLRIAFVKYCGWVGVVEAAAAAAASVVVICKATRIAAADDERGDAIRWWREGALFASWEPSRLRRQRSCRQQWQENDPSRRFQ